MERKEVAVYLYLGVLIVASLLAVYFFNLQLTGFAVIEQNTQAAFDEGVYENVVYDANTSAVVLGENQTIGTYVSETFDASESVTWNNLTWEGTGALEFEVRSCADSSCFNESFSSIDIGNLNITGQYFQYKVIFDSSSGNETLSLTSVSTDYSVFAPEAPAVTLSITNPTGTKTSRSNIPLTFVAVGENLTCWYNVRNVDSEVIGNTTLSGCGNSTFTVTADGDYTVNLYANGSLGSAFKSSSFLVNTVVEKPKEKPKETLPTPVVTEELPPTQITTDLSLQTIETPTMNPSSSSNLNLVATNNGNLALTSCKMSVGGDFASWLSVSDSAQDLGAGEVKNFALTLNVPEESTEGSYAFSLTVQCAEITKNSEFSVNVVKKRVEFNITNVERTRQNRVAVSYDLEELLDEDQTVRLQFFLYDAENVEVGNASAAHNLSAGESDDFRTNIAINESLSENMTLTLSASVNSQQYSVSVREPITLGSPTGFFVLGDDLGTTGNVVAIVVLLAGVVAIFFFLKRKSVSKKTSSQ